MFLSLDVPKSILIVIYYGRLIGMSLKVYISKFFLTTTRVEITI
jgi:hypothetical protein